jgi:UDP-GlcNAc:undecaprenyl-phosphate GlcNAc-1-phosphate transferase
MQGDTNHFSHRLVALGLTQKQAVLFIYVITLAVALCALPLRVLPLPDALVQGLTVALLFVVIGVLEWVGMKRGNYQ